MRSSGSIGTSIRYGPLGLVIITGLAALTLRSLWAGPLPAPKWAIGQRVIYRVRQTPFTEGEGIISAVYVARSGREWAYDLDLTLGGTATEIVESRILRLAGAGGGGDDEQPPAGVLPLSHSVHSGQEMLNFLLGNPRFVHINDVVTIVSGNGTTKPPVDVNYIRGVVTALRDRYGDTIEIHVGTAGVNNVVKTAEQVNDIDAISFIYEPDYADFPNNHFDNNSTNAFINHTVVLNSRCFDACHDHGLDFTWRVTGRLFGNGPDYNPKPPGISYGEHFAAISDGCTVQTQRFLASSPNNISTIKNFRGAVDKIVDQYQDAGVLGQRRLTTRITVGQQGQSNEVSASMALTGCRYAWTKNGVDAPAIWPTLQNLNGGNEDVNDFYDLRRNDVDDLI